MTSMSLETPTLRTARLLLRPFADTDADEVFALHTDARVMRYWDSAPWDDPGMIERFLARCRALADDGTGARVAVEHREDGRFVGWIGLQEWDRENRSANLGYVLAHREWGQGYATEAAHALLQWAFAEMNLNRVSAQADTRNGASRRVLEKVGFVLEGTLRENVIVNGEVSDDWTFGLLRREWEALPAQA